MQLLFKQRMFSWLDSYDIFDEAGNTVYTVKSKLAWGHCLRIYDANNNHIATVTQKLFTFLPKFEMYLGDNYIGCISREFSFRPRYNIDCKGWRVEGDFFEWDYTILGLVGEPIATITKEFFNWTDTYSINVYNSNDAIYALMLVLAIDAEKCSRDN